MNLPDIQSISRQFTLLSRIKYGKRIHPTRDWFVLLVVTALLIVLAALWSTWIFLKGPEVVVPATVEESPTLAPKALEEADALFDRRVEEARRYRSEYRFVDPSVPGS